MSKSSSATDRLLIASSRSPVRVLQVLQVELVGVCAVTSVARVAPLLQVLQVDLVCVCAVTSIAQSIRALVLKCS